MANYELFHDQSLLTFQILQVKRRILHDFWGNRASERKYVIA